MGTPVVGDFLAVLLKNPFFAYFAVLSFLVVDSFFSSVLGDLFEVDQVGLAGTLITSFLNFIGVNIQILSWQLLFIVAIIPLILFVVRKSGY